MKYPVILVHGLAIKNYKFIKSFGNIEKILLEKYPADDEMDEEINDTVEYYYSVYEQNYGYTKEEFLSNYGFASEKDFLESLELDYRRNKYYEEYAENLVTDKEIDKYYEDEVFGDVDSKHILVKIDKNGEEGLSAHPNKVVSCSQYHKGIIYSGTGVSKLWYCSVLGLTLQYQRYGIVAMIKYDQKRNVVR